MHLLAQGTDLPISFNRYAANSTGGSTTTAPIVLPPWYMHLQDSARAFEKKWGISFETNSLNFDSATIPSARMKDFQSDLAQFIGDMPLGSFDPSTRKDFQKILDVLGPHSIDLSSATNDGRTLKDVAQSTAKQVSERYIDDLRSKSPPLFYGLAAGGVTAIAYLSGSKGLKKIGIPTGASFKVFNSKLKVQLETEFDKQLKNPQISASGRYDLSPAFEVSAGLSSSISEVGSYYAGARLHNANTSVGVRYTPQDLTLEASHSISPRATFGGNVTVPLDSGSSTRYAAFVSLVL